jgi:hypothetical protein
MGGSRLLFRTHERVIIHLEIARIFYGQIVYSCFILCQFLRSLSVSRPSEAGERLGAGIETLQKKGPAMLLAE